MDAISCFRMPLGVPYYAFIFDLSGFVFFVWIWFHSLISFGFHCICYVILYLSMWILKKVFKVVLIKAQNKHTLGIVKESLLFILWVTPLITPPPPFFFSGTRCYCCIELFGKMEILLHLSSEPQSHFCRQSKSKQPHNTHKLPAKRKKNQSGYGHTNSIDLGTFWAPYPVLQSTECHTLQTLKFYSIKMCFYIKG